MKIKFNANTRQQSQFATDLYDSLAAHKDFLRLRLELPKLRFDPYRVQDLLHHLDALGWAYRGGRLTLEDGTYQIVIGMGELVLQCIETQEHRAADFLGFNAVETGVEGQLVVNWRKETVMRHLMLRGATSTGPDTVKIPYLGAHLSARITSPGVRATHIYISPVRS